MSHSVLGQFFLNRQFIWAHVNFSSKHKLSLGPAKVNKVKTCQNSFHQKFPYKNEQIYICFIFFSIFELILKFYAQFYLILNFSNSCNGKVRAVIEKEIALIMHQIVIVDA